MVGGSRIKETLKFRCKLGPKYNLNFTSKEINNCTLYFEVSFKKDNKLKTMK